MKALLNLFVESAAKDEAAFTKWKSMHYVIRTATAEQNWRRKEPTPRRKQPSNVKYNLAQRMCFRAQDNTRKSNNDK